MKFDLIKEVAYCFYPPKYKQLKNKGFWKSYNLLLKTLFISFLIAAIILVPYVSGLRNEIIEDVSKITIQNISGTVDTTGTIQIPSKNPLITIDLNEDKTIQKEMFVIDQDEFQFKFFGKRKIDLEKFKNPGENKEEIGTFLSSMLIMLAPGFAFIIFIKAAIKYLLITLLFSLLVFFIMDLTEYRAKLKQVITITTYAGAPIVLIEIIMSLINPQALLPFLRFLGLNLYAVTMVAWFFYAIGCVIATNLKEAKKE